MSITLKGPGSIPRIRGWGVGQNLTDSNGLPLYLRSRNSTILQSQARGIHASASLTITLSMCPYGRMPIVLTELSIQNPSHQPFLQRGKQHPQQQSQCHEGFYSHLGKCSVFRITSRIFWRVRKIAKWST